MHAQRCPMAKLRAAAQQNTEALNQVTKHRGTKSSSSILPSMVRGIKEGRKKKQNKISLCQRSHSAKSQDRPSFFQKLHGDVVPLMPTRPQMYSDDAWRPAEPRSLARQLCHSHADDDLLPKKKPQNQPLIYNENCAVHGRQSGGSRLYVLPKSVSCPSSSPADPKVRQKVDAERLKNWRRNSLTFTTAASQGTEDAADLRHAGNITRHRSISSRHELRGVSSRTDDNKARSQKSTYPTSSPSSSMQSTNSLAKSDNAAAAAATSEARRSQFRRAWSLFSIGCDEVEKKPPPQKILRPPTRHVYRRGISGLPIECTSRHLGVAF